MVKVIFLVLFILFSFMVIYYQPYWYYMIFSFVKNALVAMVWIFWNDLRKYGQTQSLIITVIVPTFIIESNMLMDEQINMYKVIELAPITFMYLILYISWSEILDEEDLHDTV